MTDEPTLVDALAQLSFELQAALARHASVHELSPIQTRLLGVLRDRTPTMAELATLLDLDKSSVSGLVDRAASRDLVVRVPSTSDRRTTHVHLSSRGRRLAAEVATDFEHDVTALTARLSPTQRGQLLRLTRRLLTS